MNKIFRKFGFTLVATLVAISFYSPAQAQTPKPIKTVSVQPFLQEVSIGTSDSIKNFNVEITNRTDSVFKFKLVPVDFGQLDETGGVFFAGVEPTQLVKKYGLANWMELDRTEQSLAAGQTVKVPVTIFNRLDLSPGGHYGAIFINSAGESSAPGQPKVSFKQTISALVLAVKHGGEKYDLHLDKLITNSNLLKAPSKVDLRFKNNGNTHVVPRGTIKLISGSRVLSSGVINEDSSYVLPESYRQIPVKLRSFSFDNNRIINTVDVQANYRYDGLERSATKTYKLKWIYWPVTALILAISAAVLAGIIYAIRSLGKKPTKR